MGTAFTVARKKEGHWNEAYKKWHPRGSNKYGPDPRKQKMRV